MIWNNNMAAMAFVELVPGEWMQTVYISDFDKDSNFFFPAIFFWWMWTSRWVMNVQYTQNIHNSSTHSHASEEGNRTGNRRKNRGKSHYRNRRKIANGPLHISEWHILCLHMTSLRVIRRHLGWIRENQPRLQTSNRHFAFKMLVNVYCSHPCVPVHVEKL